MGVELEEDAVGVLLSELRGGGERERGLCKSTGCGYPADIEDELQEEEEQEEGEERLKKRKAGAKKDKGNKRARKEDGEEPGVSIILERQVSLTFSLKYLTNFAKSAPLAREVTLHMSNDVPLLVQFEFEQGTLQFFLAPKIADE